MTGRLLLFLCLLLGPLLSGVGPASAHEIPAETIVRMFIKPDGQTLRVLARLPLKAVPDPRRQTGILDPVRSEPLLRDAVKAGLTDRLQLYENGRLLPPPRMVAVRLSREADGAFSAYDRALAHLKAAPLSAGETLYWEQGLADVELDYPIAAADAKFALHAAFDGLGVHQVTVLQFIAPGGVTRAYELEGDAGRVELDPGWWNAASRFVGMGFHHILDGTDHLLFLLCLVIPFRRLTPLIAIVTAFTVAHSITLIASAYGLAPQALWFPPLIEVLIASSILYMALENIVVGEPKRRWIITFAFGLVHGFGFSFGLQHSLQFAGAHLLSSLLAFNIGVELGQLLVLCLAVPALGLLFKYVVAERVGIIILSVLVAHQGWHWLTERLGVLSQFNWPVLTAEDVPALLGWTMAAVALAGLVWLTSLALKRWFARFNAGA